MSGVKKAVIEFKYKNALVKLGEPGLVYEPAEDSFLLAEFALKEAKPGMRILEIGAGSGFVSAVLKANVPGVLLLATEINPHAAKCAKANGVEVVRTDLFRGIKGGAARTAGASRAFLAAAPKFDIILFNPPYLPTSDEEKVPGWLNYAFDGGKSGRETLDRFLEEVGAYLSPGGKVLLLVSSITGIGAVREKMEGLGFEVEVVGRKKVSFEELVVVRGKSPV